MTPIDRQPDGSAARPPTAARRWRLWGAIAAGVVLVLVIALMVASRYVEPIARAKVIALLREHYQADVELKSLSISLFPEVHVEGEGLTFREQGGGDVPPLITMRRFAATAGYLGLFDMPKHVRRVRLEGLEIRVSKKDKGEDQDKGDTGKGQGEAPFLIVEVDADGTLLEILPKDEGKDPLRFEIYKLKLHSVGRDRPMRYDAQLRNAKPPGMIDARGTFGPWRVGNPGGTPLTGDYRFANADLSVFKGIAGHLASTGKFGGQLDRIEVEGETDVPDFAVQVSGHPVHLKTQFKATVDGTSGDTFLHPVDAQFGATKIRCEGAVAQKAGVKGKTVSLNATVTEGRLEDVLRLGTKSKAPMRGAIRFRSKVVIPPGDVDVVKKLYLKGSFGIEDAKFTSLDVQKRVTQLSNRAQGQPEQGAEGDVATDLKGRFELNRGSIKLADLAFAVPGATVTLDGSYGLESEELDFVGTARLTAKVSQTVTGFKSVLLKAVDPFFKKQGAGAVIPIKITGTREHPSFGLKLRK